MSNDAMNPPPQRPRSTPIPNPDNPGRDPPAPTPAQFLGEERLPWTQQPGYDVNTPFATSSASGFTSVQSSWLRKFVVLIVFVMLAVGGVAIWLIVKQATDFASETTKRVLDESVTTFQLPTFPVVAPLPTTVPASAVQPGTTIGPAVTAVVPITAVLITVLDSTTLPTAPPTVVPTEPPPAFPGGVSSLYEGGAARVIADQLDEALPGEPTQFTQVIVFPEYAVVTAQDPARPPKLLAAYWRDGGVVPADVTSTGGPGDLTALLFTGGDVNWEAIATLVAYAPAALNIPDGHVTSVNVQRFGFGNRPPIVIDVYVEGPSGKGYLEASASGEVLGLH